MREWVIYAGIMAVVFVVFFRSGNLIGALAGLFISGPLYLAFGAMLAKFGYRRRTMAEMREQRQEQASAELAAKREESQRAASSGPRKKPPPTSRTSQGTNRPSGSKRKRR